MRKTIYIVAFAVLLCGAVCTVRQSVSGDTASTEVLPGLGLANADLAHQSEASEIQQPIDAKAASGTNKLARIVETHEKMIHYTVSIPVHETHTKEVNYTVLRPVTETREKNVNYTVMTQVMEEHTLSNSDEALDRVVKTIKYIPECRVKTVSYNVTKMVPESRTKTISYKTCRMVTENRQKTVQYTTSRYVPVDELQSVVDPLHEILDPMGTNRCLK